MTPAPWWSPADQAELELHAYDLVDGWRTAGDEVLRRALVETFAAWFRRRRLASRAAWSRRLQDRFDALPGPSVHMLERLEPERRPLYVDTYWQTLALLVAERAIEAAAPHSDERRAA
jgi:hypothetical protein